MRSIHKTSRYKKIERKEKMPNEFKRVICVVPIEKCEADIPIPKGSVSPTIKRTQIP